MKLSATDLDLVDEFLAKRHPISRVTGQNQYARKACPSFDVRLDALSAVPRRRAA